MTKTASAPATCRLFPSLFSDPGNLAQRLEDAFLAVRNETERRAAPLCPEDQLIQSMPDASPTKWHRAHTTWFFEQFLLGEHCRGLPAVPPRLRLPVQFLLRQRRPAPCPPSARPHHPAQRRRGRRLSPPCRCGGREILPDADEDTLRARAAGRGRAQSRAAASGIDVHRHPARLCAKPDPAGLRSGLALSGLDAPGEDWSRSTKASTPSAMRTTAFISTTKSPRIALWSARSRSRAISSPTANGSPSCTTAATGRRRCG